MKNPMGFGVAVLATASFVFAGGEGDKKGGEGTKSNTPAPTLVKDGWSGGAGKGLAYTSDNFSLKLKSGVQVQLVYNNWDVAGDQTGFNMRRARTVIAGHLYNKNITYKLQTEWRESAAVKDAWLDWRFYDKDNYKINFRIGQLKTRYGRDWNTSYGLLEFADRGLATRTFAGARTRGAIVHGTAVQGQLQWSLGLQNGDTAGAAANAGEEGDPRFIVPGVNDDLDNELNWNFDVMWTSDPKVRLNAAQGDLSHTMGYAGGLALMLGNSRYSAAGVPTDLESTNLNLWGDWRSGTGIAVTGEYLMRSESPDGAGAADADSNGWQVAGTWTAAKIEGQPQWAFGLRYASISSDDAQWLLTGGIMGGGANVDAQELELSTTCYYHGHDLKTQLGVKWQGIETPAAANTKTDNYLLMLQTTFTF